MLSVSSVRLFRNVWCSVVVSSRYSIIGMFVIISMCMVLCRLFSVVI